MSKKFFDIDKDITVGDVLAFNSEFFDKSNPEYSTKLQFGGLDKPYGRKITSKDHKDLICIKKDNQEIWLKRFWG